MAKPLFSGYSRLLKRIGMSTNARGLGDRAESEHVSTIASEQGCNYVLVDCRDERLVVAKERLIQVGAIVPNLRAERQRREQALCSVRFASTLGLQGARLAIDKVAQMDVIRAGGREVQVLVVSPTCSEARVELFKQLSEFLDGEGGGGGGKVSGRVEIARRADDAGRTMQVFSKTFTISVVTVLYTMNRAPVSCDYENNAHQ